MEYYANDYELLYMYRMQECAIQILIQKYRRLIHAVIADALSYLSEVHHQELFQLAIIKLIDAADCYRFDQGCSFATYYNRLLDNLIVDYQRKMNRERRLDYRIQADSYIVREGDTEYAMQRGYLSQDEVSENWHINAIMRQVLEHCTPLEQQIVELKVKGYNLREIAEILGRKPESISYFMNKIRKREKNL